MTHKKTLIQCGINLIGTISPILIAIIIHITSGTWTGLDTYYTEGQLYIISAALLTSSAYFFFLHKIRITDRNSILFWVTWSLVLLSSLLYALLFVEKFSNERFLKYSSYAIILVTLILYYVASFTNQLKIDVSGEDRERTNKIMDKL